MEGACLDDGVWNRGQALVIGLYDNRKTASIRAHERGEVCDQVDGCEVIGVSDLQRLQEAAQPIVAEAQRLGCTITTKRPSPSTAASLLIKKVDILAFHAV